MRSTHQTLAEIKKSSRNVFGVKRRTINGDHMSSGFKVGSHEGGGLSSDYFSLTQR